MTCSSTITKELYPKGVKHDFGRYLVCPRDIKVCGANTYGHGIELKSNIPLIAPSAHIESLNIPAGYVCSYKVIVEDKFIRSPANHN